MSALPGAPGRRRHGPLGTPYRSRLNALPKRAAANRRFSRGELNLRFGSKADIRADSGMSDLPPGADLVSVGIDVR